MWGGLQVKGGAEVETVEGLWVKGGAEGERESQDLTTFVLEDILEMI